MSVDLSVIIRTNFRKRDNEEATLKKLEETAVILNKSEGTTSYLVDTDDSFDRWCIRDFSEVSGLVKNIILGIVVYLKNQQGHSKNGRSIVLIE